MRYKLELVLIKECNVWEGARMQEEGVKGWYQRERQ